MVNFGKYTVRPIDGSWVFVSQKTWPPQNPSNFDSQMLFSIIPALCMIHVSTTAPPTCASHRSVWVLIWHQWIMRSSTFVQPQCIILIFDMLNFQDINDYTWYYKISIVKLHIFLLQSFKEIGGPLEDAVQLERSEIQPGIEKTGFVVRLTIEMDELCVNKYIYIHKTLTYT